MGHARVRPEQFKVLSPIAEKWGFDTSALVFCKEPWRHHPVTYIIGMGVYIKNWPHKQECFVHELPENEKYRLWAECVVAEFRKLGIPEEAIKHSRWRRGNVKSEADKEGWVFFFLCIEPSPFEQVFPKLLIQDRTEPNLYF